MSEKGIAIIIIFTGSIIFTEYLMILMMANEPKSKKEFWLHFIPLSIVYRAFCVLREFAREHIKRYRSLK